MEQGPTPAPMGAAIHVLPRASKARDDLTLREVCEGYMAAYDGRDTARARRVDFWCRALGELPLAAVDADRIADVLQHLAEQPVRQFVGRDAAGQPVYREIRKRSAATVNRYRMALAAVLTWARERRYTPRGWQHPVRETKALPEKGASTRFLSPDERERLLKICRLSKYRKLHLLVLLAITTGARKSELLGLRHGDLDLSTGTAYVRTSKNDEPRVLVLVPAVLAELKRHGAGRPEALLFPARYRDGRAASFGQAWRNALQLARIERFRFHDLRHSCASYLAQSGASLLEIADVLGHKSLKMTQRYSHLTIESKKGLVHRVLGGIQ